MYERLAILFQFDHRFFEMGAGTISALCPPVHRLLGENVLAPTGPRIDFIEHEVPEAPVRASANEERPVYLLAGHVLVADKAPRRVKILDE